MSEFKVGDLVVVKGFEDVKRVNTLYEYKRKEKTVHRVSLNHLTIAYKNIARPITAIVRHATPEEIKTGRRISPDQPHATKSVSEWSEHRLEEVERVKRIEAIERDY